MRGRYSRGPSTVTCRSSRSIAPKMPASGDDECRIIHGCANDALARLVNMDLAVGDARYRADRKKKVAFPEPEEAAGTNFKHLNRALGLINK
jgi:hypothetical protein